MPLYVPVSASGIPTGAAFPTSPAANDLFHRTDRGLTYFYDGTRWLSVAQHQVGVQRTPTGFTATSNQVGAIANPYSGLYDIWAESVLFEYYMNVTGNWTINFYTQQGLTETLLAAATVSTVNSHTATRVAVDAVVSSSIVSYTAQVTENSGTSTIFPCATLMYRLIG